MASETLEIVHCHDLKGQIHPQQRGKSLSEEHIRALHHSKPGEKDTQDMSWLWISYGAKIEWIEEHKLKNATNTKKINWTRKVKGSRSDNDVIFELIRYANDCIMFRSDKNK